MGEIKTITFQFNISIFTSFRRPPNHLSYQLSDIEKNVLAKGLNFALPPKKLNYTDYLRPYERYKGTFC